MSLYLLYHFDHQDGYSDHVRKHLQHVDHFLMPPAAGCIAKENNAMQFHRSNVLTVVPEIAQASQPSCSALRAGRQVLRPIHLSARLTWFQESALPSA